MTITSFASGELSFWPNRSTICENSIFIIEGHLKGQKVIKGLETIHNVYLKSSTGKKISLSVERILVGQLKLAQAILRPDSLLILGETYELIIENLDEYENLLYRYNTVRDEFEKITWTVTSKSDNTIPAWTDKPVFKYVSIETFSLLKDYSAIFTKFSCPAFDDSEYIVKTKVRLKSTGVETTYYLIPTDNMIWVGHDMISGAFNLALGECFEVKFALMDASGNSTKWADDWIEARASN